MPGPGPIYNFLANIYEGVLSLGLRVPWLTLLASFAAVALGVLLFTGVPSTKPHEEGKPPEMLVQGLKTGLMPAMDSAQLSEAKNWP